MSRSDDIETVKRAADAQTRRPAGVYDAPISATGEHLPEQGCCGGRATETHNAAGEECLTPGPLEEALRAAEGWGGLPPGTSQQPLYAMGGPIGGITDQRPERERLLEEARRAISGERQQSYGSPEPSFSRIGKMWAAILGLEEVTAEQYALCMIAVKLGRLAETPNHRDSWLDAAGYAALGGEVALAEGRYL